MDSKKSCNQGFSIIEALIAIGILGVMTLAFMSLMANQNKEFKASDEKISLQGLQLQLTNMLSNPDFCFCFMNGKTFNYTASPQVWNGGMPVSIGNMYTAPPGCTAGPDYLRVNTNIGTSNLRPTAIDMTGIIETVAGARTFNANLVISFDGAQLVRSRKNLSIPIYFKVTDSTATAPLESCSSVAAGSGPPMDLQTLCAQIGGVYDAASTPQCKPAYQ